MSDVCEDLIPRWLEHGGAEYLAALQLRREVLRWPLGLEFSAEEIAAEVAEHHLGLFRGDTLVGTLVLRPLSGTEWQMRQVAMAERWRGRSGGATLVGEAERHARKSGCAALMLHARGPVVGFYEKLGYVAEGDWFDEVTLPHRTLRKNLAQAE